MLFIQIIGREENVMKTSFLYLSEPDIIKAGGLDYKKCMNNIEEAFGLLGKGDYLMGGKSHNEHGMRIDFPEKSEFPNMPLKGPDRRFMAMMAYLGGRFNVCGEKWYGSNIINKQRMLPRSILMVMLNNPDTCEPICLLSGNIISSMRTGCVAGIGALKLANKNSKICTIIGCGPINRSCFIAIKTQMTELETLVLYNLSKERAIEFAEWAEHETGIKTIIADNIEDAVRLGDIISIAASRRKPVELKNEWIKKGATVILSGNCHFDDDYWLNSTNIFDNTKMHEAYIQEAEQSDDVEKEYEYLFAGQLYRLMKKGKYPNIKECISMGDIILGKHPGRTSEEERINFITGGMAVFDVSWGFELYQNAIKNGIGQELLLWDGAYCL